MGRGPKSQHILESIDLLFDQRQKVNPLQYPFTVHGFIYSTFSNTNIIARGTGTLIGDNTVLTAAHCLCRKEMTPSGLIYLPAKEVYFFSGYAKDKYLHGDVVALKDHMQIHPAYLTGHGNYDIALLHLNQNIGEKMGFASLNVLNDIQLNNRTVNVSGYPGHMGALRHLLGIQSREMYSSSGPVVDIDADTFHYRIDTSRGQSGAGVWGLDTQNIVECYGVHVLGSKTQGNGAIRINIDNFKFITDFLKKFNDL